MPSPSTRSLLSLQLLSLSTLQPSPPPQASLSSLSPCPPCALPSSSLSRQHSCSTTPTAGAPALNNEMLASQAPGASSSMASSTLEPQPMVVQLELDVEAEELLRLQRRDKVRARLRTPWRRAPLATFEMRAPPVRSASPTPQRRCSSSIEGRPCAPTPGATPGAKRGVGKEKWERCVAKYTMHETIMTDAALLLPSTYQAVVQALLSESQLESSSAEAAVAIVNGAPEWSSIDFVRWARSEWRFGSAEEAVGETGITARGTGTWDALLVNAASGKPAVHPERLYEVLKWAHSHADPVQESASVEKTRERLESRYASIPTSLIAQFVALCGTCSARQAREPELPELGNLSPMSCLPSPVACFSSHPPASHASSAAGPSALVLEDDVDVDEEEEYTHSRLLSILSPFAPASILQLPQAQGMDRRDSADSQVSAASSAQPPTPRDERDGLWPSSSPTVLDKASTEVSFSLPSVFQQIAPSTGDDSFFGAPTWSSSDAVLDVPTELDPRRWWWEQDGCSLESLDASDSTVPSCDSVSHDETLYTAVSEPALHRRAAELAAERPTASAFVSFRTGTEQALEAPTFSNRMPPPPALSFAAPASPRRRARLSSDVPSSAPSWQTEFGSVAAADSEVPASTLHALLAQDEQRQVREATLTRRMQRAARLAAAASEELSSVVPTLESSLPTTTAVNYGPQFGAVFGAVTGGSGNLFDGSRSQIDAAAVAKRTKYGSPDLAVYLAPSYGIPSSDTTRVVSSASATLPRRAAPSATDQATSFGSSPVVQGLGLDVPQLRSTAELRRHTVTGERTSPPLSRGSFDAPPLPQPPCYSLADVPKARGRSRGASVLDAKPGGIAEQQQSQRVKWDGVDPFEHLSGAQRLVLSQVATLMAQQNLASESSHSDDCDEMVIPIISTIPVDTQVQEITPPESEPSAESDLLRLAQLEAEIKMIKARQARLQPLPIAGQTHHARERARHEADQTLSSAASSDLELSRDMSLCNISSGDGRRLRGPSSARRSILSRSTSLRASPDMHASWSCSMTQSASFETLASASSVLVDGVPLHQVDPRSPARRRIGSTSLCEVAEYACSDELGDNDLLLPRLRFVELPIDEPICSTPAAAETAGAKLGRRHPTATAASRRERSSISLAAHHEPLALLCAQRSLRGLPARSLSTATTSAAQATAMPARSPLSEVALPAAPAAPEAADLWADFSGEYTDESFTGGAGALVASVPSGVSSAAMAHAAAILEAAVVDARAPTTTSTPAAAAKMLLAQQPQQQSFLAKAISLLNVAGTPSTSRVQAQT